MPLMPGMAGFSTGGGPVGTFRRRGQTIQEAGFLLTQPVRQNGHESLLIACPLRGRVELVI